MGSSVTDKIAARLRELREARGWSLADLSSQTKGIFSKSRIGNYEQGTRDIGVIEAIALSKALETSAAHLLCLDEDSPVLSPEEAELIRHLRVLPENERRDYMRRIAALAMAYQEPVPDERLTPAWRAPAAKHTAASATTGKRRKKSS